MERNWKAPQRTQLAATETRMKRIVVSAAALLALATAAAGAAHVTAQDENVVCLPPAVVQAWS